MSKLKDHQAKARVVHRIDAIRLLGHFGDTKSVGGGVHELHIFVGKGYRIYYGIEEDTVVLLLLGGNKGISA